MSVNVLFPVTSNVPLISVLPPMLTLPSTSRLPVTVALVSTNKVSKRPISPETRGDLTNWSKRPVCPVMVSPEIIPEILTLSPKNPCPLTIKFAITVKSPLITWSPENWRPDAFKTLTSIWL